jgi:putative transposase
MDVLETLADAMLCRGRPGYLRSDNGPEFVACAPRGWVANVGTQTAYIEPGSPWRMATAKASIASCETSC